MDKSRLNEIGGELDISKENIRSIRWERWRQKWIFPVAGSIFAVGSTIIGYLSGRNDTYYINGEPARSGYPWSMSVTQVAQPLVSFIPFAFMIPILGSIHQGTIPDKQWKIMRFGILFVFIIL